ncbi:hypothetical protein ACP275_06G202700 [Erythranthe tilingii]
MAAETTIMFAVKNIDDLLIEQAGSLQGVEDRVKCLKDELQRLQRFMKDAAQKQGRDERIFKWISDVRDAAKDADSVADAFVLKVEAARRSIGGSSGKLLHLPKHSYELIGKQIEAIGDKLRGIERSRERFGIVDLGEGMEYFLSWRSKFSPRQMNKQLVGMDEDVEFFLEHVVLDDSDEGLSIATVVGPGGIGKSTLARRIYDGAVAAGRFDRCVWLAVSGEYTPKDVIKEVMLQLLHPQHDKMKEAESLEELPLSEIQGLLHRSLSDARLFLVIDDVGQDAQWEAIASVFTIEDEGSRLLLTSRNEDIAKDAAGYVHKMSTLDPNKSWELFTNNIFIDNVDGKFPEDLEIIGREILKKCDGLPLAIDLVAGLLGDENPSKSKWDEVLNDINTLSQSSTGSSTVLSTILELSYRDLPPQLKSCFLCLGFFKERVPIRAEKLVQVWIAQGLVVPLEGGGEEETKEEIGMRYLNELINRNMVQVKDLSTDGRVKNCCIHDLVRELSVTRAKTEIIFEIQREDEKSLTSDKPPRHLVRHGYNSGDQNEHVHSLFFHGVISNFLDDLTSFELLKILDFEDLPIEKIPETIGLLTRLRYLGLRNTRIESLPESVGRLKNLEVLDITKVDQVEMDDVIWEMESLRHLYGGVIYSQYLLKTHTLKNIQTLGYIYVENLIPAHLMEMSNLRKLSLLITVSVDFDGRKFYPFLAMLENLAWLEIKWGPFAKVQLSELKGLDVLHRVTRLKLEGIIANLPDACEFPPNLSHLTLKRTCYDKDPMPVLEKLPKLVYLKMDRAYSSSDDMVISEEGFPVLEILCLFRMVTLDNILIVQGAMPKLKDLRIIGCGKNLETNLWG